MREEKFGAEQILQYSILISFTINARGEQQADGISFASSTDFVVDRFLPSSLLLFIVAMWYVVLAIPIGVV